MGDDYMNIRHTKKIIVICDRVGIQLRLVNLKLKPFRDDGFYGSPRYHFIFVI